jgi:Transposase DDE domain
MGEERIASLLQESLAVVVKTGAMKPGDRFRIYTAGQKRRMTPAIKREMRRRAAIEPVIGHLKNEHRMRRNYLAHAQGDAINAILAAAGYNFRLLLNWLMLLLCLWSSISRGRSRSETPIVHGRLPSVLK